MDEEILYNIIEEKCKFEFQVMELKIKIERLSEQNSKLQSKIDKIKELKHNWIDIIENETLVFENNNLIEFMNNLEDFLKEDK